MKIVDDLFESFIKSIENGSLYETKIDLNPAESKVFYNSKPIQDTGLKRLTAALKNNEKIAKQITYININNNNLSLPPDLSMC